MNNFARVKYSKPPTKAQLVARIAKGELLQGSDAVLANELGLGLLRRTQHMQIILIANGENPHGVRVL